MKLICQHLQTFYVKQIVIHNYRQGIASTSKRQVKCFDYFSLMSET